MMSSTAPSKPVFNPAEWLFPDETTVPPRPCPQPDWAPLFLPNSKSLNQAISAVLAARKLKPSDIAPIPWRLKHKTRNFSIKMGRCIICPQNNIYSPSDLSENRHLNTTEHLQCLADTLRVDHGTFTRFRKPFICNFCSTGFMRQQALERHQSRCTAANASDMSIDSPVGQVASPMDVDHDMNLPHNGLSSGRSETALQQLELRMREERVSPPVTTNWTPGFLEQEIIRYLVAVTQKSGDADIDMRSPVSPISPAITAQLQEAFERISISSPGGINDSALSQDATARLAFFRAAASLVSSLDWTHLEGEDLAATVAFWIQCQQELDKAAAAESLNAYVKDPPEIDWTKVEGDKLIAFVAELFAAREGNDVSHV
ncbi:unnamed protein product [Somion occarium]|uniref:C2H2-type domain-containing protein n=1 Tax=Somion occarium TaxID=3059160 RepID=A0ABP1DKU3_9APHY